MQLMQFPASNPDGPHLSNSSTSKLNFRTVFAPSRPLLTRPPSLPILRCGQSTRNAEVVLRSLNYPRNYPDNTDCAYVVFALPGMCRLRLEFVDFIVEESAGCNDDSLTLDGIK